jgi:hypothetical protein
MIDWYSLIANSLWIVGCALALAAFSYASWQASLYHQKLLAHLRSPGVLRAFSAAGVLFCLGLTALSDYGPWLFLWGILAFLLLLQFAFSFRQRPKPGDQASL